MTNRNYRQSKALQFWGAFLILAAGSYSISTSAQAHTAADAPLIIVTGPTDGPYAILTREALAGAEHATAHCEAKNLSPSGVRARSLVRDRRCARVALVVHACGSGAAQQATLDTTLLNIIGRRPALVIGHPCDHAALRAADAYQAENIPFIAVGVRDPSFWKKYPNTAHQALGANRADEMRALLAIAFGPAPKTDHHCTLAIAHDQTQRNKARLRQLKAELQGKEVLGGCKTVELLTLLTIKASKLSYKKTVATMSKRWPTAIVLLTSPIEGEVIVQMLIEKGFKGRVTGPPEWITSDFASVGRDHSGKQRVSILTMLPHYTP
ncbi:MAG: hypothetical protein AAFV69_10820, partial [Pseudomonadota bacterium]